jgi:hypothetical protein
MEGERMRKKKNETHKAKPFRTHQGKEEMTSSFVEKNYKNLLRQEE